MGFGIIKKILSLFRNKQHKPFAIVKALDGRTINVHIPENLVSPGTYVAIDAVATEEAGTMTTRKGNILSWKIPHTNIKMIIKLLKGMGFKQVNWEEIYEV